MISVPSIARYTALWLLAMAVVLWTPWWREADWRVFGLLNKSNTPSWPQQWVIVDVPYEDADGDPTVFRREISDVLAAIRERQRPRMVILDVYFSSDPRGLDVLQGSLRQLRDARIPVFAAINPVDQSGNPTAQFMSSHAAPIYQQQLDGFGHTQFEFGGSTLKYEPFLALSSALAVPALAVVVAEQQFARPVTSENTSLIVNVGKPAVAVEHTVRAFRAVDGSINFRGAKGSVDLTGTNVLIGSLDKDRSPFANRSGPELLAWALIERTSTFDAAVAQRPLTSDWIVVVLATVVPLASVLAFLRLRRLPRRQTLTLWVPALGAVVLGLTLVAMWIGLTYALGYLYPRVTLVAVGVMLAVALAWWFSYAVSQASFDPVQIQGLTFSGPSAEWLMRVLASPTPAMGFDFGLLPGVFAGSFVAAWMGGDLQLESFGDGYSMPRYIAGAVLMGFGAMLAGGIIWFSLNALDHPRFHKTEATRLSRRPLLLPYGAAGQGGLAIAGRF